MRAAAFWKSVTLDRSGFLDSLIALFDRQGVRYCVVGGQGVNAYVEPLVSLDLDIVIAAEQLDSVRQLLRHQFEVEEFPHSLNVSAAESQLRVQIQTDSRYFDFVNRASRHEVLGVPLPVASIEDVLQGKIWAAAHSSGRPSKRRKDLLDIERILERFPELRERVPADLLARLE
jgi:hypothetical protein